MSQQLSELCTLLVDDLYGELPSHLFSVLLKHSRLSLAQLAHHAALSRAAVRNGLAVLIQHNLALFSAPSPTSSAATLYQANVRAAYQLVRLGRHAGIVHRRYGAGVAAAFQSVLEAGHTTLDDIDELTAQQQQQKKQQQQQQQQQLQHAASTDAKTNGDAVNGSSKNDHDTAGGSKVNGNTTNGASTAETSDGAERHARQLVDLGLVRRFRDYDTMSELDAQGVIERMIFHEMPASYKPPISGPKKEKEFRRELLHYKRKIRDDEDELREPPVVFSADRLPDPDDEPADAQRRKRRKLNDGRGYGPGATEEYEVEAQHLNGAVSVPQKPDDAHLYHADVEKLTVFLRSDHLVDLCDRRLGVTPSKVYSAILTLLEKESPRCFDELEDTSEDDYRYIDTLPSVTSKEVAAALDRSLDLAQEQTAKPIHAPSGIPDPCQPPPRGPVPPQRIQEVDQYLRMLAEHPAKMLTRTQVNGATRWKVNFVAVAEHLAQTELENIIASRFGPLAARIVRILAAKGKLDEKQVAQYGLVRQRELRAALAAMQAAGFVDTQEVPRDATRQPSRTIYLWAYDAERARALVLDDTYKAMARLLQRARAERRKARPVLDKAERSDVRGREHELLSTHELQVLRRWQSTEHRLLVQLARQDDVVAVMRDFLPTKREA